MIKKIILLLIVLGFKSQAQVGINTTTPKAQLEIKSTNETTPANTDGLIIPKINAFPAINPTADQQGMLVYLTTAVGANTPGFYYWNNPTTAWLPVKGTDGGTLDQAYDFGGAGLGRTITADAGAVTINGTDGLVSTGTSGSGATVPSGAGTRMVWNPRKAAFRVGNVSGTQWDDLNIGTNSVAFGSGTIASGSNSTAFGNFTTASGPNSIAFGSGTTASNNISTAFGSGTIASGPTSTAFGFITTASGASSTTFGTLTAATAINSSAFGRNNTASSYGETVIGIGATTYTASPNGTTQFRIANLTDRLFVIGNAIDANNNDTVETAERSDAMVVLKNGNIGVGISTPQNRLHFHNQTGFETFMQLTNSVTGAAATDGLLLGNTVAGGEAAIANREDTNLYLFSGLNGEGQITIGRNGNTGIGLFDITNLPQEKLHVDGKIRMVDGNQAAGKVLTSDANGTATWTTAGSIASGTLDQAYDFGGAGNGRTITADSGAVTISGTDGLVSTGTNGSGSVAPSGAGTKMFWNPRKSAFRAGFVNGTQWDDANIGIRSVAFGFSSIASGSDSFTYGNNTIASGSGSIAFGFTTSATGQSSTAFGRNTVASEFGTTAFGDSSIAAGVNSTAFGSSSTAFGSSSTAFGLNTIANANVSTAFGSSTTANGHIATAFGSGTTANGYYSTVFGEKNSAESYGETVIGIGATTYTPSTNGVTQFKSANATDRLFVIGNAIDTNSNLSLEDSERRDALVILKNGNTGIGISAPGERLQVAGKSLFTNGFSTDNAALLYRNDTDYMFLGPQSGSSADGGAMALYGSTNVSGGNAGGVDLNVSGGSLRMTSTGNVGIGATPVRKFEVTNAGIVYGRITNTGTTEVGFELKRSGSDWQMRNETGLLFLGQSNDDLVTVTDVLRLGGTSVTPAVDNGITLGNSGLRWTNVFAVNGTIQTSDANDKKEMKALSFGLDKIKQLRPISFQWKDNSIDNSATHLGFVAQEVQQVLPEVIVDSDWVELPEGQGRVWQKLERLGMKYAEIIPVLVKAVQEQQEVIEHQKTEIESLKSQLKQQQKAILERLQKLEAKN